MEYKKLLSCWHKLEHFSPATLPKGKNVEELKIPELWNRPLKSSNPKKTIEYTIYIGVFEASTLTKFIDKFFNDTNKDENQKSNKILFASLKLDINGYYINESIGVSTLPWALSQLEKGQIKTDHWSDKFEELLNQLSNDFDYIFNEVATNDDDEITRTPIPVSLDKLKEIQEKIESLCGWSVLPEKRIYVKYDETYISTKNTDNKSTTDLLNSFYIKDLETIISNFDSKQAPRAFLGYLSGSLNYQSNRIDISTEIDVLQQSLSPINYPDGCWPSDYTLSLMQQFAVNSIFNGLSDPNQDGILSVNGPPGTGKTTLLRDIIAPILVKRAKALSLIDNPADAFTKIGQIYISDKYSPFIYAPDNDLTNAGIVVASSNNGAVENISKELPLKNEVASFSEQIEYFKEVAESCVNKNNWGLISAVLGNKANRKALVDTLWFNKNQGFKDLQKTLKFNKVENDSDWNDIVCKFNDKLAEVTLEKEKLEIYKKEYLEFLEASRTKNKLEIDAEDNLIKYVESERELKEKEGLIRELKDRKKECLSELVIIKENKPSFFIYWFNWSIRAEYKKYIKLTLREYNDVVETLKTETNLVKQLEVIFNQITTDLHNANYLLFLHNEKLHVLQERTEDAKSELKNNYADSTFWREIESKKSQESCPWYSPKLKELQSELFVISLKLNEKFLLNANANSKSSRISTTLAGFFEYLKGNITVSHEEVKAMWDTFFLVIPVVSSTFASIQTMFKGLDKEDIPWLFIDEAGQAVPQAAAGAIWRSKRVAVVGDPFQIEPVVTIPKTITNNISNYFELTESQINSELSVQSMADRINPLGRYLNINGHDIWIGIPLRIHRRCLDPMFSISNRIAYDDTMYLSTVTPEKIEVNFLTSFIHCEGSVEGRHFVEKQAEIIRDILISEISTYKKLPDIFVITPFKEISDKLNPFLFKPLIIEVKKYQVGIDRTSMGEWLKTHVGTVHTFQGKEANGVILCLGLDGKTTGSAGWASDKPNLLNVAITRAKYRFIAVGNKNIWLNQPYFRELGNLALKDLAIQESY